MSGSNDWRFVNMAERGYREKLKEMLDAEPMLANASRPNGRTALHYLAAAGDADSVALLLAHGANANARREDGSSPLLLASGTSAKVVRMLVLAGADVNCASKGGATPLHRAVDARLADTVCFLLKWGANPNTMNGEGRTPLHIWAGTGGTVTLRGLIESGAVIDACDPAGNTPLHLVAWSAERSWHDIGQLLAHGPNVNARNKMGKTALHLACQIGDLDKVSLLLRHSADPNISDCKGLTPCQVALNRVADLLSILNNAGGQVSHALCGLMTDQARLNQEHSVEMQQDAA